MCKKRKTCFLLGTLLLSSFFLCGCLCIDDDEDGYYDDTGYCLLGNDCNDEDAEINPGAEEICGNEVDENCDGIKDQADDDNDSYIDTACGGNDCDDSKADVNPAATEGPVGDATCSDGMDNNCDGKTDDEDVSCYSPTNMALIPSGCFSMGDSFAEGSGNERPVHQVCLSAFWMDMYEVTNAEYKECVDASICSPPSQSGSITRTSYYGDPTYDDYPVIYVNWDQANAYCTWAEKRLPTEAEWEYAARGALEYNRYPSGDTIGCGDANYGRGSSFGTCWNYAGRDNDTHAVGTYAANGFELYDMAGNVFEWVKDWYDWYYYQYCVDHEIVDNPPGPETGSAKVLRGGNWSGEAYFLRVTYRHFWLPTETFETFGFRCVR